jgi:hypothetical protein
LLEVATMKLSVASRMGAVTTEDEAQEFARMIADEAKDDDWIRVLYAVDMTTIEPLSFRVEREPKRKTG